MMAPGPRAACGRDLMALQLWSYWQAQVNPSTA